jgi:hypothetical protein
MTARTRSEHSRAKDDRAVESERPPLDMWSPSTALETPPDAGGYRYRWVREMVNGTPDNRNVQGYIREKWERVRIADLDEYWQAGCEEDERGDGYARTGGLILMKTPLEYVAQREAHYRARSQSAVGAANELQGLAARDSFEEDRSRGLTGRDISAAFTS